MKPFRFSFSVQLCPKEHKYAYEDGDMCCSVEEEKEDGGHTSEFAWKYLCEKSKDNFYLHLDKLWEKKNKKLINKKGEWKANEFFVGIWKFQTITKQQTQPDPTKCVGENLLKIVNIMSRKRGLWNFKSHKSWF